LTPIVSLDSAKSRRRSAAFPACAVCLALAYLACAGGGTSPTPDATGGIGTASGGRGESGGTSGRFGGTTGATGGATGGAGLPGSGGTGTGGASTGGATGGKAGAGDTGGSRGGEGGSAATGGVGPSDAGADGAATGGGTGTCNGLLCEDFEGGQIDTDKWMLQAKGGTLEVQSQRAAHGKYAVRAHGVTGTSDDWAILVAKSVPPALKGTSTFGRVYAYIAADATASIHVQMTFAGHNGTGTANGPAPFPKLRYMEVASYSGRWQQGFDLLDLSPLVEEVSYSTGRIPTGKWVCVEWQFEDQPDRVTVWADGAKVASFDNTNVAYASPGPTPKAGGALWDGKSSDLIGGFDTFGFGFHDWHPQKAFDIDYDDFVLDAKRVGCLP